PLALNTLHMGAQRFHALVGALPHHGPAPASFPTRRSSDLLCGGGIMLGAWFMATDYVTSPITKKGQIIYGILLGILTGLFRLFGDRKSTRLNSSHVSISYAVFFVMTQSIGVYGCHQGSRGA